MNNKFQFEIQSYLTLAIVKLRLLETENDQQIKI